MRLKSVYEVDNIPFSEYPRPQFKRESYINLNGYWSFKKAKIGEEVSEFADNFRVLDCIAGTLEAKFDFIYAVAVVHMLVQDADRAAFYRFIREHLKEKGIGLVCTMGDGELAVKSDISKAFDLQERTHGETGEKLLLAGTSCRMVTRETFHREIRESGFEIIEQGLTSVEPDFPVMMYAVLKKS